MKKTILLSLGLPVTAALLAFPAAAHPGHGDDAELALGFLHPLGDVEIVFLMICAGVFLLALAKMIGTER